MTKIKNILLVLISLIVILALILNYKSISNKLKTIFNVTPELVILPPNKYTKDDKFMLVTQVEEYVPYNYQDLMNIFYSALNQGWDDFTFYCPIEYTTCLKDVERLSLDEELLSNINNFVHPYNSYSSIKTLYDDTGKIELLVTHLYDHDDINLAEEYVNDLFNKLVRNDMNEEEIIRKIHDYIINNTKYDKDKANHLETPYDSSRINGIIVDHYALCSAYSDLMAVVLERLDIPNFKVSSESHVWNAVFLNGRWLHLDLTWDDPITTNGRDILDHNYFLITDERLKELSKTNEDHNYDKNVYLELK